MCWESNLGPLEEQPVLLDVEPSLQALFIFLSYSVCVCVCVCNVHIGVPEYIPQWGWGVRGQLGRVSSLLLVLFLDSRNRTQALMLT